jgi:WD40 repeat protein
MDNRLRVLDLVDAPEQWEDIERRVPRGTMPSSPSPWPRILTVMVALAVAAAGTSVAVVTLRGGGTRSLAGPASNGEIFLVGIARTELPERYGGPRSLWTVDPVTGRVSKVFSPAEAQNLEAPAPRWTPDGSRVLWFTSDAHYGPGEIWTETDGKLEKIVSCGSASSCVRDPEWSPDGTSIAFARGRSIWVVNADGTDLRELTTCENCTGLDGGPAWSPDGSRIAFAASDADYAGAIHIVDIASGRVSTIASCDSKLCRGGVRDGDVSWSPTRDLLLFSRERNLWSVRPDGSDLRRLTVCEVTDQPNQCEPRAAIWSPDGDQIAYVHGDPTLLTTMEVDGSDARHLELPADHAFYVDAWQPVVADESPTSSPLPTPTETPTPSPVSTAEVGQTIDVGQASALIYAEGSLWIDVLGDAERTTGTVLRIDPGSGEIQARIPVDAYPDSEHGGSGMVFDGQYLWIVGTRWSKDGAAGGILVRIDPVTDTAETIDLPVGATGNDLVFDDGFLWTTGVSSPGKDPRVLQFDPVTGAVISETPIDAEWWGGLVVEGGAIWVMKMSVRDTTVQGDATLVRLEPSTGAVLARVPAVDDDGVMGSTMPVAAQGAIWLPTGGELLELDPQTGEALSRFDFAVGGDFELAPDRSLWCLCGFGWNELERLNPGSGQVDVTVHLDRNPIPTAVAVAPGSVWVLTYEGTLIRVALS